jgi:predicted nuclease of predicted toxin-antitoxin system
LVRLLADAYPESSHVRDAGLRGADDEHVWIYARDHGYCIASKDNDFRQRSFLRGSPPKVVWLAVGNAGTAEIAELLRRERLRILSFESDDEASLLVLPLFGGV